MVVLLSGVSHIIRLWSRGSGHDGNGGFKIVYDTRDKWTVLKLLNDDYVSSLTTDTNYEITGGKRRT